ncbi:MAG: PQQ-binding-like beta-propeller repeat protein, partial [Myxococcota bacterium]|nr:PQQ-binding-like beta-propeller repeat protein [Myxococcota bacterium]
FAAGGSGDGFIYGIQKASGKLHWKFRTNDKIESDPVVFNKRLFVSSGDGHLYAFIINSTAQQKN